MKFEKSNTKFNDLFSEVIKKNKNDKSKKIIPNKLLNLTKKVKDTVIEGFNAINEMKKKNHLLKKDDSKRIVELIKTYSLRMNVSNKSQGIYLWLMIETFFAAIVAMLLFSISSLLLIGIVIPVLLVLGLLLYMSEMKKVKNVGEEFLQELIKIPVVFKDNKIYLNMLIYSHLSKDDDAHYNEQLMMEIKNVLEKDIWIKTNDVSSLNLMTIQQQILKIEEKMKYIK